MPERTRTELVHRVQEAAAAWQVELEVQERQESGVPAEDGWNALHVLSERDWVEYGAPHGADAETRLYTRRSQDAMSAEIVEADVLLQRNLLRGGSPRERQRLHAVLVHELGHLLGLDHVCEEAPSTRIGLPDCSNYSDAETFAMHPASHRTTDERLRPHPDELHAAHQTAVAIVRIREE